MRSAWVSLGIRSNHCYNFDRNCGNRSQTRGGKKPDLDGKTIKKRIWCKQFTHFNFENYRFVVCRHRRRGAAHWVTISLLYMLFPGSEKGLFTNVN